MSFLRFLMFLSVAGWIGALIFFPVLVQTAFSTLPSTHLAGLVVRGSLLKLHWMAFTCGLVFLTASLIYDRIVLGRIRPLRLSHLLVVAMLGLTAWSQFRIIPRMDTLRASAPEISSIPPDHPIRRQFDSLHAESTRTESAVLVLAMIVLYSTSRRFGSSQA